MDMEQVLQILHFVTWYYIYRYGLWLGASGNLGTSMLALGVQTC
jgi:hypothetical protein